MRKQRPRGTITRDAVVSAGLLVADRDGVEQLTIRAVADQVGAAPMSLYAYFENKEDLLDLMFVEIAGLMYAYQAHSTWQEELLALGNRVHGLLTVHPNWAALLSRPVAPLAVPLREEVLKLMVADGIPATDAWMGLSAVIFTAIGPVLVKATLNGQSGSGIDKRFNRLKEWVDTPAGRANLKTHAALKEVPEFKPDLVFQFTLQALITGLEALRAPPAR